MLRSNRELYTVARLPFRKSAPPPAWAQSLNVVLLITRELFCTTRLPAAPACHIIRVHALFLLGTSGRWGT